MKDTDGEAVDSDIDRGKLQREIRSQAKRARELLGNKRPEGPAALKVLLDLCDKLPAKASGAANRAARKDRAERERQDEEKRREAVGEGGRDFSDLPPAPAGDPAGAVAWFNEVLMVCADKVVRDPVMPLPERIRFLSDLAAKAGMIRDKAAEQHKIREILQKEKKAAETAGLTDAKHRGTPRVPRPPG